MLTSNSNNEIDNINFEISKQIQIIVEIQNLFLRMSLNADICNSKEMDVLF